MQEIYKRIETNDDGEIDIKTVVEHIKAIEAGSGKNSWVASEQTLTPIISWMGLNFDILGKSEASGFARGTERSGPCRA